MRHESTVFASLLKLIARSTFNALVKKHGMDAGVRGLTTRTQFCAMLFAQLSGAASLRDLVTSLSTHKTLLYHAGIKDEVRRSTLSDANRTRSHAFFDDLFAALLTELPGTLPRKMRSAVRLIDSTNLPLSTLSSGWAQFSAGVFAAKLHVVYDPNADRPVYFVTTPANVNDITPAKAMAIEPEATYVFDLGYYDFGWWAALDAHGCRLVTRLKKNTRLDVVAENKVAKGGAVLSDRIGHLPSRLTFNRRNYLNISVNDQLGIGCDRYIGTLSVRACQDGNLRHTNPSYDFYTVVAPTDPRLPNGGGYRVLRIDAA